MFIIMDVYQSNINYYNQKMNNADLVSLRAKIQQHIPNLSKKSRYQILLISFMSAVWVLATFNSMIGSFVFMNPLFECDGESATQTDACRSIESCRITNSFTATQQCQLYCDKQITRSTIQSLFFFGCIVGMFTLASMSDTRGRRFSILAAFVLQIIGVTLVLIGIYTHTQILIIFGMFLTGMFMSTMTVVSYIMTGQFCNNKIRQKSIMLYCAMWGLGEMCFILFYQFMPQWYNFLILGILLPAIGLFFIASFFIIETPQFCLFMGKDYNKFKQSIQYLDMYNDLGEEELRQFEQLAKNKQANEKSSKQSITKLIKSKNNLICCLCIAGSQLGFNIYYYGVQGSMQRTGYNFGVSMFLVGIHEFVGYLLASYVVDKIPRKKGLIVTIIISSLIGLSFLLPFVKDNQILQSIVVSLTRLCSVFGYSFIALLQTQSFPTQIKSTGMAVSDGLSQLGKVAIPYLINLMNDINIHPLIFSSTVYLIIGILPLFWIKQTLNKTQKPIISEKDVENPEQTNQNVLKDSLLDQQYTEKQTNQDTIVIQ